MNWQIGKPEFTYKESHKSTLNIGIFTLIFWKYIILNKTTDIILNKTCRIAQLTNYPSELYFNPTVYNLTKKIYIYLYSILSNAYIKYMREYHKLFISWVLKLHTNTFSLIETVHREVCGLCGLCTSELFLERQIANCLINFLKTINQFYSQMLWISGDPTTIWKLIQWTHNPTCQYISHYPLSYVDPKTKTTTTKTKGFQLPKQP